MNAMVRLVAGVMLATAAVTMTGCGSVFPTSASNKPLASLAATGSASASATSSATATAAVPVTRTAFAPSPAPRPADPILTSGAWGYHGAVDWDDDGDNNTRIHSAAEQTETIRLLKEQNRQMLSALKKSKGVKRLALAAGGDVSDITYSVVDIDVSDEVGVSTPWVTATLRASFPSEDGLKAVDVRVYRLKTLRGLNNTPYVSGTSVGYVGVDGSIAQPSHPRFPR